LELAKHQPRPHPATDPEQHWQRDDHRQGLHAGFTGADVRFDTANQSDSQRPGPDTKENRFNTWASAGESSPARATRAPARVGRTIARIENNIMRFRFTRFAWHLLTASVYASLGALLVAVIVFALYLDDRPELDVWHTADLDEEFTEDSDVATFGDYLALEQRLFKQLDEQVYAKIPDDERRLINRYDKGSLSDPSRWSPNWNRSFVLPTQTPKAAVLSLHGMSDSPYSLRALGQELNAAGALVLGLRIPGHGTAPSGLVEVSWQDMAAAVRLAMRHLAEQADNAPISIVGYSNGAALAVHYALSAVEDETLPKASRLVLISPAIGVSPAAALAVWQGRIGNLLGIEQLNWNSVLPEYDPFKYGSFAVNAGDVVYRLTKQIQLGLNRLTKAGMLQQLPPMLAFSSIVDATVSTPALVTTLFERLPAGDHELVLFDINREAEMEPIMKSDPMAAIQALRTDPTLTFTLSLVGNESSSSHAVVSRSKRPGEPTISESKLGLSWPDDVYSLSHVALPFPPGDAVYGGHPTARSPGIHLSDIALRGERGVLQIPASDMLRLRWNPFYPYMRSRVFAFLGLGPQ
jgi:alpha-beta hydrolase superfamily lysophospholipase